jgi:hypothetical protein
MVIESIREFNRAAPLEPDEIRMAGGKRQPAPQRDFIPVSRKGSIVMRSP